MIAVFYVFISIVYEFWNAARQEKLNEIYNARMSLSNHAVYIFYPICTFCIVIGLSIYDLIFQKTLLWHFHFPNNNLFLFLLGVISADFSYYVHHVVAHRWNIVWGAHIVHHQSTDYNLSLNSRAGVFEPFFRIFYALPFAIIGVPGSAMAAGFFVVSVSMFWLHTRMIGSLGPVGRIFNTPAYHRVHHYKDIESMGGSKNFGGLLIIWDRIFGTFRDEQPHDHQEFGTNQSRYLLDPVKSQTYFYKHLFKSIIKGRNWRSLELLFNKPLLPIPNEVPNSSVKPLLLGECLVGVILVFGLYPVLNKFLGSMILSGSVFVYPSLYNFGQLLLFILATFQIRQILNGAYKKRRSFLLQSVVLVCVIFWSLLQIHSRLEDTLFYVAGTLPLLGVVYLVSLETEARKDF